MNILSAEETRTLHQKISARWTEILDAETPASARGVDTLRVFLDMPEGMGKRRSAAMAEHEACSLLHVSSL